MIFKIEGVWCKTRTEFDKLYKSNGHDLAISYTDIYNRLVKSDPYNEEPSDIIITLYIRKMIKKALNSKLESGSNEFTITYMFNNLNQDSVDGVYDFMTDLFESKVELNLTVINRSDYPKHGVLSKFDNVKFIDNG